MTGGGDELVTAPAAGEPGDGPPQLFYAALDEFVREQLAPMYRRALDGTPRTWCPEWWRHAEAISRLEALWRAWEHLRVDPATGISVWFRDHADHHMSVLLLQTPDRRLTDAVSGQTFLGDPLVRS